MEELTVEGTNTLQAEIKEISSVSVGSRIKKPRAIVIKATNKELDDVLDFIETQFPSIQVLYVTTGPTASILRVTRVNKPATFTLEPSEQSLSSIAES